MAKQRKKSSKGKGNSKANKGRVGFKSRDSLPGDEEARPHPGIKMLKPGEAAERQAEVKIHDVGGLGSTIRDPSQYEEPPEEPVPEPDSGKGIAKHQGFESEAAAPLTRAPLPQTKPEVPPAVPKTASHPKGLEDFAFEKEGLEKKIAELKRKVEKQDAAYKILINERDALLELLRQSDEDRIHFGDKYLAALDHTTDGKALEQDRKNLIEYYEAGTVVFEDQLYGYMEAKELLKEIEDPIRRGRLEKAIKGDEDNPKGLLVFEEQVLTVKRAKRLAVDIKDDERSAKLVEIIETGPRGVVAFAEEESVEDRKSETHPKIKACTIPQAKSRFNEIEREETEYLRRNEKYPIEKGVTKSKLQQAIKKAPFSIVYPKESAKPPVTPKNPNPKPVPTSVHVSDFETEKARIDNALMARVKEGVICKYLTEKMGRDVRYRRIKDKTTGKIRRELDLTGEELARLGMLAPALAEENSKLVSTVEHLKNVAIKGQLARIAELEEDIEHRNEVRKGLDNTLASLREEIEGYEKKNSEQGAELETAKRKIEEIEAHLALSKQFAEQLTGEGKEKDKSSAEARAEADRLAQQLTLADLAMQQSEAELPGLLDAKYREGETDGYERAKKEFDAEAKKREQRLNRIIKAAGKSSAAKTRLESAIKAAKEKYAAELARSDAENEELTSQNNKLREENEGLRTQLEERGKTIEELSLRPTQETVDAHFKQFTNTILEEWMPIEDAERLLDVNVALSNDELRKQMLAEEEDRTDNYRARVNAFVQSMRQKLSDKRKEFAAELKDAGDYHRNYVDSVLTALIAVDSIDSSYARELEKEYKLGVEEGIAGGLITEDEIPKFSEFLELKGEEGLEAPEELKSIVIKYFKTKVTDILEKEKTAKEHEAELEAAEKRRFNEVFRTTARYEGAIRGLVKKHDRQMHRLANAYEERIKRLKAGYDAELSALDREFRGLTDDLLKELEKEYDKREGFEQRAAEAEEQVRSLTVQSDMLRRKLSNYLMEAAQLREEKQRYGEDAWELIYGLREIGNTDFGEFITEEGKIDEIKYRRLIDSVPERLHYVVNNFISAERPRSVFGDIIKERDDLKAKLKAIEDAAAAVQEGDTDKLDELLGSLKGLVPESTYLIIERGLKGGPAPTEGAPQPEVGPAPSPQPEAKPQGARPVYADMPRLTSGTPIYGVDFNLFWLFSDKISDLREKVGYLRGRMSERILLRSGHPYAKELDSIEQEINGLNSLVGSNLN